MSLNIEKIDDLFQEYEIDRKFINDNTQSVRKINDTVLIIFNG